MRKNKQQFNLWLDPKVHEVLRDVSWASGKSMHSILVEEVEPFLRRLCLSSDLQVKNKRFQ
jgi:hypothetical protein